MAGCNCNVGLSNTGKPGCVPIQSVTASLIMVPLKANDGTANFIDLSAPLPVWNDLVNEADASKRWFPLPLFENVELPKAESQFEEANSGRMAFLRQGKRSFTGELWGEDSTPTLLNKLQSGRCVEFGIYIVDVTGNLVGSKVGNGLYPIPVDAQSWNPTFMFATDSTVQKIMVAFDFDRLFNEGTMYMITSQEAGVDFTTLTGLIDVNLVVTGQTPTTEVVFNASFDYGTALNPVLFTGASLTDFTLFDVTGATFVTIDALNEGPNGTYTILQSVNLLSTGDDYLLSVNKDGFVGSIAFVGA
jgi:hypothetical protein